MSTTEQTPDAPAPAPEAGKPNEERFRYARWLHAGEGAEECEHRDDNLCENDGHFHAYCRLPNQFQHADIRDKAMAAKARRMRQLRDSTTDSNAILEADLDELARAAERDGRQPLVEELVRKDWWKHHLEAVRDIEEHEEYEHINQDRERLAELERIDAEERPREEFEELQKHLAKFGEQVQARRDEIEAPLRDALDARDVNELVDLIREDRIAAEASALFMDTYSRWQMFAGTLRGPRDGRVYAEMAVLEAEAPDVVEALRVTFTDIEAALSADPS